MANRNGTLRTLAPLVGARNIRGVYVSIALAIVAQTFLGLLPLIQGVVVDDAIIGDDRPLVPWIALLAGVGLCSFVFQYLRRRIGFYAAAASQRDLQKLVHHHLQHLDEAGRGRFRTGDLMSRAASDLTVIQMFLQQLGIAWGNLTLLVVAIVAMVFLSPVLSLVLLITVPSFIWVATTFRAKTFAASYSDQVYKSSVAGVVEEAVTGVAAPRSSSHTACTQPAR